MKFISFLFIIFITFSSTIKADSIKDLKKELLDGGKLIFIRHAYAPGGGDPDNFNINECNTQRNLSDRGKKQAIKIKNFFIENQIQKYEVFSSEWCRCKETASLVFGKFKTKKFLNSFYSPKFEKNKKKQIKDLKKFIKKFDTDKNIILVTHYVVISEVLDYAPSSGEIVISDKSFKKIGSVKINY